MKLALSNRFLAALFILILAVSLANTYLIVQSNDSIQKQRDKDASDFLSQNQALREELNQTKNQLDQWIKLTGDSLSEINRSLRQTNESLNQFYSSLNESDHQIFELLNGKIDNINALLPIERYDYIIYREPDFSANKSVYLAKNGRSGIIEYNSTSASTVFNQVISKSNNVYVKNDQYLLNSNVYITNKKNARLDSDGATLILSGNKISINGDDFEHSQNNQISGFIVVNGTLRIENSFRTTTTNMIFDSCTVGIELANTHTWTECTKIDAIHFTKCTQAIIFRTNSSNTLGNTTGSYANTAITRCYFNQLDNSIGISVEAQAEVTDSQLQDIRMWLGEFGKFNQIGLALDGSMYKTIMQGVVFESFAALPLDNASFYAIKIGPNAYQSPILDSSVNFLGSWTARISNRAPNPIWIFGVGGVFKQSNIEVPVGFGSYGVARVISVHPANIAGFKPKISVQGDFSGNQTVTVRIRLEFVDNVNSDSIEKNFSQSGSVWFSDDDMLKLYAYPNVIYAILVDAKMSSQTVNPTVQVDIYGMIT